MSDIKGRGLGGHFILVFVRIWSSFTHFCMACLPATRPVMSKANLLTPLWRGLDDRVTLAVEVISECTHCIFKPEKKGKTNFRMAEGSKCVKYCRPS